VKTAIACSPHLRYSSQASRRKLIASSSHPIQCKAYGQQLRFERNFVLAAKGNPNSTQEYSFISNAFAILRSKKTFIMNGNPDSTHEYSNSINGNLFLIIQFTFLWKMNSLPINGNPNSINDIPKWQIAYSVEVWSYCIQQNGNSLTVNGEQR
jgi:hypothetical protein